MSSVIPRAVARVIGGGLRDFIDAGVQAIRVEVARNLPTAALGAPARHTVADDLRYAASRMLPPRGFHGASVYEWVEVLADSDTLRVRARHECGALLIIDITARYLLTSESVACAIVDAIDRAGCYCVPRETSVPCTARRCE